MALVALKGKRKGKTKGVREFDYQGFNLAEAHTLDEILSAVGNDEGKLVRMAAVGFNKEAFSAASDPFYGLIPDTYNDEQRKSIRIAAREIMKALGKTAAQSVKMVLASVD